MRKVILTAVALSSLVVACGGTTDTATTPAATTAPTVAPPKTVDFHLSEFKIDTASTTLKPGDYIFNFSDDGKFPHDFHISLQGSTTEVAATTKPMKAGETDTLKLTLAKGVYTFWCAVGMHRKNGMEGTLTVA